MTWTTRIRINYPINPVALLDAVTIAADGTAPTQIIDNGQEA